MRYFFCLLSGEMEVFRTDETDGTSRVVNTLRAGQFFGENALLEGRTTRLSTMRCATPVEVLMLAKDDFEVGMLGASVGGEAVEESAAEATAGAAAATAAVGSTPRVADADSVVRAPQRSTSAMRGLSEEQTREKLLGFLQMVSRSERATLRRGEAVFREGDPAERFYILSEGRLAVARKKTASLAVFDGEQRT